MQIANLIPVLDDKNHRLVEPYSTKLVVIHRIELRSPTGEMLTPYEICLEFMRRRELGTGLDLPYTYLIDLMGRTSQCLPLSEAGAHAANFNRLAIGVGCLGNFEQHEPGVGQYRSLVELCSDLLPSCDVEPLGDTETPWGLEKSLSGHFELDGSSKKDCPGKKLPMGMLRHDVNERIVGQARVRLGATL